MSPNTCYLGDCRDVMRAMDENSVDAIVTDPPYGIGFMGRGWDHGVPGEEFWIEALRVLKPGGHLLAFGGTRMYHRLVCAIEDAGLEIRDTIAWVYGSGMPKALDVSKAIDKAAGVEREVVGYDAARERPNRTGKVMGDAEYDRSDNGATLTAPATDAAKQWEGWATGLKPAFEAITVARKPLIGTVVANVLQHGTGALNIDACRVPLTSDADAAEFANNHAVTERLPAHYDGQPLGLHDGGWKQRCGPAVVPEGRWPANLVHDGSDEVLAAFPAAPGQLARARTDGVAQGNTVYGGLNHITTSPEPRGDVGSAARFFYCAKASRKDRNEGLGDSTNVHNTVKPTALMRYLCRLVTPAGGLVLDPFMGSGSTGKAALMEGFRFIGIELDPEYFEIAKARIAAARCGLDQLGLELVA